MSIFNMDIKTFLITFGTIFLAELGDKTQIATFNFAAEGNKSKLSIFLGSAAALVLTSFIGVMLGSSISRIIPPHYIKIGGGILFIILGLWMLLDISK
ncbi:MAG: TMEM165/GDT1 family protein [Pseudomonadota bacterium]